MTKIAKTGKRIVVSIDSIKPHPKNAKLHPKWQIEKLGQLIDKYGYDQIIVIDEKKFILKGAGRWESLKERGYTNVEVEIKEGLTEDEKLAMMISDNKIVSTLYNNQILIKELPKLERKGLETIWTEKEIKELFMHTKEPLKPTESTYELSPKLYEHYNYILLFYKDERDFKQAKQMLGLKSVQDRMKPEKIGILRAIDGNEAFDKLKRHFEKVGFV